VQSGIGGFDKGKVARNQVNSNGVMVGQTQMKQQIRMLSRQGTGDESEETKYK
jgi:hypothetical protein